jgi:HlyD family secretion protein
MRTAPLPIYKESLMRTRNLLIVLAGIVAVILIAVFARDGRRADLPVATVKVAPAAFKVTLAENGVVMSPRSETVPTLVAGNLRSLDVREGEHVVQGQLLATVYDPTLAYQAAASQADYNSSIADVTTAQTNERNARVQYQAQLDTAKSQLDLAQRIYDEDVALFKNQAISRNQLDTDKAKLDQARVTYQQAVEQMRLGALSGYGMMNVQSAEATARKSQILNAQNQQQLSFTRIVAPFDGIVQTIATEPNDALRTIRVGDPVTQGEALFTIAPNNKYIVRAEVDEQDVINVHVGQQALISGEDFPGITIPGHVEHVAPVATKSTDTSSTAMQVLTTIRLDRSPPFLKDGMNADVDIVTTNIPHALAVPSGAIVKQNGRSYVYVVKTGAAKKQLVVTGGNNDTQTLIRRGLNAGDVVIAQQYPGLSDGTNVSPTSSPTPLPFST